MSQLEVDKVLPQSGTTLTLGESGDTITIPSGATFSATLTAPVIDEINDNNGNEEIIFTTTTSAVNELTIANAATGNAPEISATGDDTDIDLKLTPKGSGKLVLDGLAFPNADGSANQVIQTNGSGVLSFGSVGAAAGQVIQVVSTSKTNTFSVSSSTYTDVTDLSVSITPSSASNKILVLCYMNGSSNQAVGSIVTRLVRDSTAISIGDASGSRIQGSSDQTVADSNHQSNMNIMFLDSPNTTSATTYKIQIRGDGAANHQVSINRSQADGNNANNTRTASSITVMEIKG